MLFIELHELYTYTFLKKTVLAIKQVEESNKV